MSSEPESDDSLGQESDTDDELNTDVDVEYTEESQESLQPVVRRQNFQRIVTQDNGHVSPETAMFHGFDANLEPLEPLEELLPPELLALAELPDEPEVQPVAASADAANDVETLEAELQALEEPEEPHPQPPSPPTNSHRAPEQGNVIDLDTPSPPKKRKRLSAADTSLKKSPESTKAPAPPPEDEDDGLTCPICLDSWEMSGEHRLVSLRCGHLFGEACIRRWLGESQKQSSVKVCPQCKTKATYKDIRHLYAKRILVVDTEIRDQLEEERRRNHILTTELSAIKLAHYVTADKLLQTTKKYNQLVSMTEGTGGRGAYSLLSGATKKRVPLQQLPMHRLYMEKNFEITRDPGCRVLHFSGRQSLLMASQKSGQSLFPGYGVRFIDPLTFQPLQFLYTTPMMVRNIAFSDTKQLLAVSSRESKIKLFDVRTKLQSCMVTANDRKLWACALDRNDRDNVLYGGDLRGGVYIYDVRFPDNILSQFQADENFSPVIHIEAVPPNKTFHNGGFLVCQLSALTFYEFCTPGEVAQPTRLNVDGPFLSMQYDYVQDTLLISARCNPSSPNSRFVLGQLDKIDNIPVLRVRVTIYGPPATPIMTRPTQLGVEDNTLIVGYLQESKQLMLHDVRREERVQTMPVNEVIYDFCPVSNSNGSYLAALTDNKCRVYKLNSTG
ncbi:E3 ubiquitin-protein ligase RFWD3 [Drosophila guanche]|uniref:RING-type E3 ubiquitin transferase n=1 Tax=Drosophila guanche TaxID=7266 RepID=A0A3B0JZS0_DROGU|nr:E3 ubiquitin-protein ligase RFWD3 [Drosophila guanche]SPP87554.1 blast:E3 ubiquitin-protein ligase RFWD3 [Drosophila guanche]